MFPLARTSVKDVFKAHIKGRVCVGGEGVSVLANNITRTAVIIAYGILDLHNN